jgi:hypothetical protein
MKSVHEYIIPFPWSAPAASSSMAGSTWDIMDMLFGNNANYKKRDCFFQSDICFGKSCMDACLGLPTVSIIASGILVLLGAFLLAIVVAVKSSRFELQNAKLSVKGKEKLQLPDCFPER